jgi:hypothetical protein
MRTPQGARHQFHRKSNQSELNSDFDSDEGEPSPRSLRRTFLFERREKKRLKTALAEIKRQLEVKEREVAIKSKQLEQRRLIAAEDSAFMFG